ncbi:hypothetical protein [Candidatus Pseudoscillospira sp. SGI.172]|uniref:hypothetical protein n=1 Tax=Candidatus Pseudoscillospira sp. SGI.172 TaxID=3420582 RepID=UPI002A78E3B1|nr:hypothetical protein [Pseudoflavonifractor sp.]MDY3019809.1 hypothetical protein [Oscillospiraceae bacterium]
MARRKQVPEVARPGRRTRLIELGKDLLIGVLACSAVLLAAQTSLVTGLRGWITEPTQAGEPVIRQPEEAVMPYLAAVRSEWGVYGAIYDKEAVDRTVTSLRPILGEGLNTAGAVEEITERRWRALLESPGVYCAFQGSPPLEVLSAWLGGGGDLSGNAEALLLAWDGSAVWLCWRDESGYRAAQTQVAYEGRLQTAVRKYSPNGVAFAYEMEKSDEAYGTLDPYVMVSVTPFRPAVYSTEIPDFVENGESLGMLLSALGFQSSGNSAYEMPEGLHISEGTDRLRVRRDGTVVFHAGEESRYPVPSEGERPTCSEAALAAWELLNRAASQWRGDGTFVLTRTEAEGEGWVLTFSYRLGGIPVLTGEDGWAARFAVAGGEIRDFTLKLRTYTDTGSAAALPRERLAAAAMNALGNTDGRLVLCYSDTGAESLKAGWVVQAEN